MPRVRVNGISIYYEVFGSGKPLIFIPGFSTDITRYSWIIGRLSKRRKVIAIDNRGSGRTDKPDTAYTVDTMADDVSALMKKLVAGGADVLGFSMGGSIAIDLAIRHPGQVKRMVLISTLAESIPESLPLRFIRMLLRIPIIGRIGTRHSQPYYSSVRQLEALKKFDATKNLYKIRSPTLILHGKRDSIVPHRMATNMHSGIRNSRIITLDEGHMMIFFRHGRLAREVLAFLEGSANMPDGHESHR